MLFPDLSAPEAKQENKKNSRSEERPAIASVADRFLALVFDFLILSPVLSLFLAALIKKTKTYFLLDAQSPEGFVLGLIVFLQGAGVLILLQSLFLYYWQATPGQLFMQMRVVSYPQQRTRLSFSQCLVRAICFCGSFILLGIPFLEVLSHPLRRPFHEKASDTLVITLKKNFDDGPEELEQRFISSWMQMSFIILVVFMAGALLKSYGSYHDRSRLTATTPTNQCWPVKDRHLQGAARMDAALALFMLDGISAECLNKEAEESLWGDPVNSQDLAYLALYLTSDEDEQQQYLQRACKLQTSSACLLGTYLHEHGGVELLKQADQKLLVTQVLGIEEQYESRDFLASLESIETLQKEQVLKQALEKKYVRSVWALNEVSGKARVPASVSKGRKSWLNDFKDRYGIE